MTGALIAHLWQSTLSAGVAWLLTLVLRKNAAQVRYRILFVASIKFLIPFSLLVGLGTLVPRRAAVPSVQPTWLESAEPLVTLPAVATQVAAVEERTGRDYLVIGALAFWACGFTAIAICWLRRWNRVRAIRKSATRTDIVFAVPIMSVPDLVEPGIVGIFRAVLLLPEGIVERLDPAQLDAVLAHELCHIRRRDNLTAAIHVAAQAIFWFHPLMWWLGVRLVDERERACDEEVLRLGAKAQVYAAGILNVCRLYVETPLACVSGVTGSNLKKRVEAIMKNRIALRLNSAQKAALTVAGIVTLALPIAVGVMSAPFMYSQATQVTAAGLPRFEVASIKPNPGGSSHAPDAIELNFLKAVNYNSRGGRFTIHNIPLQLLIQMAYNVGHFQLIGEPSWVAADHYDVVAKAEGNADFEQMRPMLQSLLADRFKLALRRETRELPIYELIVAKGGLKIEVAKEGSCVTLDLHNPPALPGPNHSLPPCGGTVREVMSVAPERRDAVRAFGIRMPKLVGILSDEAGVDRIIVDKTGFREVFNLNLEFAPGEAMTNGTSSGPSIFTALQDQLGLRLESIKGPVEVLVIDHVERPSEN